jgi:uncharacterized protein (DUF4415 family)
MSEERIFRGTAEQIRKLKDETDWERLRAEEAAGVDPPWDPEEDFEVDWDKAVWVPARKQAVSIRLDADLLAFFKAGGPGYQTRINAVLRAYKDAQAKKAG